MNASHAEEFCPNCRECEGCDGGSGVTPKNYRIVPFPGGKYASVRCADCDGEGLLCDCECHPLAEEAS